MKSLWGEIHDQKMKAFDEAISSIEKKYEKYLQKVQDHTGKEKLDTVTNHYIIQWEPFGDGILRYRIGFNDTYLPKFIEEEITEVFKEVFSSK